MHFYVKVSTHMEACMWKPEDEPKMSFLRYYHFGDDIGCLIVRS